MRIDPADIERAVALSRLELSPKELDRLTRELETILQRFEAIRDLGPDPVAPAVEGHEPFELRPDDPGPDPLMRPVEEMAPEWREGFFLLPRLPLLRRTAEDEPLDSG